MTRMPDFEQEIRHDLATAGHALTHLFGDHAAPEPPAIQPDSVDTTTATEDTMLAKLEDDVKKDLTEGVAYLEEFIGRVKAAAPGIISNAEQIGGSTVGRLVETAAGRILPPPIEDIAVELLGPLFEKYGTPQAAPAPAEPAA
jgi:hypothetical protein